MDLTLTIPRNWRRKRLNWRAMRWGPPCWRSLDTFIRSKVRNSSGLSFCANCCHEPQCVFSVLGGWSEVFQFPVSSEVTANAVRCSWTRSWLQSETWNFDQIWNCLHFERGQVIMPDHGTSDLLWIVDWALFFTFELVKFLKDSFWIFRKCWNLEMWSSSLWSNLRIWNWFDFCFLTANLSTFRFKHSVGAGLGLTALHRRGHDMANKFRVVKSAYKTYKSAQMEMTAEKAKAKEKGKGDPTNGAEEEKGQPLLQIEEGSHVIS